MQRMILQNSGDPGYKLYVTFIAKPGQANVVDVHPLGIPC